MSSCFETVEELDLRSDGSGKMTLSFNGSESKLKIASLMKMKFVSGYKVPSNQEISNELHNIAAYLRSQPGLSNVQVKQDFSEYIFSISFSFNDIALVNKALEHIWEKYNITAFQAFSYNYNKSAKTFAKTSKVADEARRAYEKLSDDDRHSLRNAIYTTVYRFDSPIKSTGDAKAKISPSRKALMQQIKFVDALHTAALMQQSVKLQ